MSGSEIQKPVNMRFYLILSLRSASPRSLLTQACVWCQKGCVYGVKNAVLWCQEGCVYGVRKAVCMVSGRLCVWCQEGCVYGVRKAVCVVSRMLCVWCQECCVYGCQEGCVYGVRKAVCYFKVLILLWLSGARRVQSPSEHSNTGSSWISSLPCL